MSLDNGGRALLLIYLRKGTGTTLLTTEVFITLLSVVGKVFCKILNNRLVQCLDKEVVLHEGQAGFRINRSCMDNVYEIVQGRLREDKKTYSLFLDIQKAYNSVWHDGFLV